jgi:hypothetical protein
LFGFKRVANLQLLLADGEARISADLVFMHGLKGRTCWRVVLLGESDAADMSADDEGDVMDSSDAASHTEPTTNRVAWSPAKQLAMLKAWGRSRGRL